MGAASNRQDSLQENLYFVLDAMPVGLITVDHEFRLTYMNSAMKRILGLQEGEEPSTVGMDIRQIPSVKQLNLPALFQLQQGPTVSSVDFPFTSLYGRHCYLRVHASPVFRDGRFLGGVILAMDVTQQKEAEQRAQELESLQRCIISVMHFLVTESDRQQLLDRVCSILAATRGYTFAWLGLLDSRSGQLNAVSCTGSPSPVWPSTEADPVTAAISRKQTVTMAMELGPEAAVSCAAVPLIYMDEVKGVLCVASERRDAFRRQELDLLEMLASALAHTIHSMNTAEALHASQQHYRTLVDTLGEGVVLATPSLTIEYANPAFCQLVECTEETLVGKQLTQVIEPSDLHKLTSQLESNGRIRPSCVELNIKTSTGISRPVRATFTEMIEPSSPHPKVLGIFVNISELKQLQEQLKRLAITDSLTGVYNRTYFSERIREEVARAKRYGHPLGFLMIDVDEFKRINDEFSHMEGDDVLRDVAKHLASSIRQSDILFRYGGDEFLVLLPETDEQHASAIIERIEREIRHLGDKRRKSGKAPVSISMGFAAWKPGTRKWEDALRESDTNMYRAKMRKKTAFVRPGRTYATE